jgi:hypothetical protein
VKVYPGFSFGRILIPNIHAADKGLVTIDDDQFTMISVVEGKLAIQRVDRT